MQFLLILMLTLLQNLFVWTYLLGELSSPKPIATKHFQR
ncbi:hypothetical protein AM1_4601 [Acaryochloris marina MBIC11017]|uniref:Uncharacterized protein n=1 Tax=Acaryochloris marina (strain MBIC 11017) TaxID=329726 RepID=B0C083_ACAM1|nr:hypothetical protein AM1_4601 [Acaryochloris marina MBIC11017]